jgi:hypothetical protein
MTLMDSFHLVGGSVETTASTFKKQGIFTADDEESEVPGMERCAEALAPTPQKTFDDQVARITQAVLQNPLHRELLYKVLEYCCETRMLQDVEDRIASYPEFPEAHQSQYILITYLVKAGGLELSEIDAEGAMITSEQKEGLSENEVDDLVADFAFKTTEAGLAVVEKLNPRVRLEELLGVVPEYYDTYLEVLEFLQQKHSTAEIDTLLRGRPVLLVQRDPGDRPIQSSVFIDMLERAGGIAWEEGWYVTPEGRELLASLRA